MGDEKHFGISGIPNSKRLWLSLRRSFEKLHNKDLLGQDDPQDEPELLEEDLLAQDTAEDVDMEDGEGLGLPLSDVIE